MANGEIESLGRLMTEAESLFNSDVAPMSEALKAPKLQRTLNDPNILPLVYGGKGVGSHGDGSVQFLARNEECQLKLVDYLNSCGMQAYKLTMCPVHTVRKAIIPVAGYGTRLYPATRCMKKDFFPIPCPDGMVRPVILILLEELVASGIEEICLVLGSEEERQLYRDYFETPLSKEHLSKLSPAALDYENHIQNIGKRLQYVIQTEKLGFGHAVYQTRDFAGNEPVLLMLGDTLYRSATNKPCALQLIENFELHSKLTVSVHPIPLAEVSRYGILSGVWEDKKRTVMNVSQMAEKPTVGYAEEFLGINGPDGQKEYYSVFGQYILTPEVYEQLAADIIEHYENSDSTREIELTTALEAVRRNYGMVGVRIEGEMFDMGNPAALKNVYRKY